MTSSTDPHARFLEHSDLPSPTGLALEVLALADREDATVDEFVGLIRTDPVLVQRLLRIVNSPFAGTARPIVDIRTAAILLGIRTVSVVALSISVIDCHSNTASRCFHYRSYWLRSLARAVAVENLCSRGHDLSSQEGFTLGLLGDFGQLVLASVAPKEYDALAAVDDSESLLQRERDLLGVTRHDLTTLLLKTWGLPQQLSQAPTIAFQGGGENEAITERQKSIARYLAFAEKLAGLVVSAVIDSDELYALIDDAVACGIPREDFERMFDDISAQWREAGKIFDVPTREVPPAAEILAHAAEKSELLKQSGGLHHFIQKD